MLEILGESVLLFIPVIIHPETPTKHRAQRHTTPVTPPTWKENFKASIYYIHLTATTQNGTKEKIKTLPWSGVLLSTIISLEELHKSSRTPTTAPSSRRELPINSPHPNETRIFDNRFYIESNKRKNHYFK